MPFLILQPVLDLGFMAIVRDSRHGYFVRIGGKLRRWPPWRRHAPAD